MAKTKNDTKSIEIASEKPKNEKKSQKSASKVEKTEVTEVPEAVYIYHTGDNIEKISQLLTGKPYMEYRILEYSGLHMNSLKDGDIIKWRV